MTQLLSFAKEFVKPDRCEFCCNNIITWMERENQTIITKDFIQVCSPSRVWSFKKILILFSPVPPIAVLHKRAGSQMTWNRPQKHHPRASQSLVYSTKCSWIIKYYLHLTLQNNNLQITWGCGTLRLYHSIIILQFILNGKLQKRSQDAQTKLKLEKI